MAYLLGIDIGTSTAKAVLFDSDTAQTVAISNGHEYPIHKPQPDFAEQNPDDWWKAVVAAVQDVMQQAGQVEIAGISFVGRCTAAYCWMPKINLCIRLSCGLTSVVRVKFSV
jgi:xylulokinase